MEGDASVIVGCRGLSAGYPGNAVLRGIDLELHRGQITAIVGGSGSGKSTLLKTLVGLLPPLAGDVYLLGQALGELDPAARRALLRRTGHVFQHGALFSAESVLENLAVPIREHTGLPDEIIEEMARMKLSLVELDAFMHRLPSQLSGGQRRRVALARAAILDPEIIFCDEPSAGLDPRAAASLDDTLCRFRELFGMSVVLISHELPSIERIADRVIMLREGSVRADGSFDELRDSDDEEVRAFFRREPTARHAASSTLRTALAREQAEGPGGAEVSA